MELLVSSVLDPGSPLPSFFEMVMTHQIQLSLKPAAHHLLGALAPRLPILFKALSYFDEVFLATALAFEGRSLGSRDCLLAESLYGLTRSRLGSGDKGLGLHDAASAAAGVTLEPLTARDRRKALLLATLLPYLKAKADAAYERAAARDGESGGSSSAPEARRRAERRRRVLSWAYPLLHAAYEGTFLACQWAYLVNRALYFSPTQAVLRQVVRRATREELEAAAAAAAPAAATAAAPSLTQRLGDSAATYGRIALVAAVVLYKVAEWWAHSQAQEGGARSSRARRRPPGRPPPPPPLPRAPAEEGAAVALPRDPRLCPLCRGARANPALCAASGYVFCYRCLVAHVRAERRCPVTLRPCGEGDVVRIFDEGRGGSAG